MSERRWNPTPGTPAGPPHPGHTWDELRELFEDGDLVTELMDEIERLRAEVDAEHKIALAGCPDPKAHIDASVNAEMRALMVLVDDEIISSDRAREIVGMTHEEQRAFWRREHKQAMREVAEKVREACANVALDYDGKGLEHDQYTQLGDAGRTLSDIEGAIRALDLEEVLKDGSV